MKFKEFLETMTSTADVACFHRISIPLVRRGWFAKPDYEKDTKKKDKKKNDEIEFLSPQVKESSENKKYSCVMFNLDSKSSKEIEKWSKKNISDNFLSEDGRENEHHVTVFYGLHANDVNKDIEDIFKSTKPFDIKFGKISKFSQDDHDVIKISVTGRGLFEINKRLGELPNSNTYPTYIPHCTLAYVKKGSCDHLVGKTYFEDLSFKVRDVVFSNEFREKSKHKLG